MNTVTPELLKLPALSIRQPWASAIVLGGKDIENRSWPTKFRGRFLIHSSSAKSRFDYWGYIKFTVERHLEHPWEDDVNEESLLRGGIIGVAELVDCVRQSESPWFAGDFGFVIRNAQPLEFYPCRGRLGFFKVEARP